jgi:hypothetical protein
MPQAIALARKAAAHPPGLAHKLHHTMARTSTMEDYGPAVQIEMDEQLWSLRQPEAIAALNARMQEIGYEPSAAAPPPGAPPPPPPPPQPGEPGFKLFKDD